ncbi:MAG: hypothetical protein CL878_06055 [Dehalococcoidia bacterium]|nr:hypothetical protein [Dehalococcoidia bacterium]
MPFFDLEGAKGYLGRYQPGDVFTTTLGRRSTWEEVEELLCQAASALGLMLEPVPTQDQPGNPDQRRYRAEASQGR